MAASTEPETEVHSLLKREHNEGVATLAVPRGRRIGAVAAAAVLGAAALAATALLAAAPLRSFAGKVGIVGLSEEEDSTKSTNEPKEGYHFETHCGTDYRLHEVLHNNLGGAGPDSGDEGIVYNTSQSSNGDFVRYILVKVNALTKYESESSSHNGKHADFGTIKIDPGTESKLKFSFFSQEDEKLTLDVFRITFYDLDEAKGGHSQEYVIEDGAKLDTSDKTELEEKDLKAGVKVEATKVGSGSDNPSSSTGLSEAQATRSVVLSYEDVDSVEVTLGSTDGKSPRNFAFALHSALACKQVEVPDSDSGARHAASPAASSLTAVVTASLLLALGRFV